MQLVYKPANSLLGRCSHLVFLYICLVFDFVFYFSHCLCHCVSSWYLPISLSFCICLAPYTYHHIERLYQITYSPDSAMCTRNIPKSVYRIYMRKRNIYIYLKQNNQTKSKKKKLSWKILIMSYVSYRMCLYTSPSKFVCWGRIALSLSI